MDLNLNTLLASLVFGSVGMGMFMYGRKAGRLVPLAAGLALMAIPYFIPNLIVMSVVCCALMTAPWVIRSE